MELHIELSRKAYFRLLIASRVPYEVLYIRDDNLLQGICYGHVLDDCYRSRDTVGSGILCFAWHRCTNTYTASDCRDRNSLSAFDWKTCLEWTKKIAFTDCDLCQNLYNNPLFILVFDFRLPIRFVDLPQLPLF